MSHESHARRVASGLGELRGRPLIREPITFLVPGALDQPTGGYQYDRRVVAGLRERGRDVGVIELDGRFPAPDEVATHALDRALDEVEPRALVLVDGLVLGGSPNVFAPHAGRLRIVALIHHALCDEVGVATAAGRDWMSAERRALACATGVITTSAYTAQRLQTLGLVHAAPHVVTPGVEPRYPAEPDFNPPINICCVAGVTPRKNHASLVDALKRVRDLDWRCDLVGPLDRAPDTAAAVRARIRRYTLDERISLRGAVAPDELDAIYRAADLFVLASRFEGYGMVVTEALAYGLPLVTTTGGALRDTVPTEAGLTVPPDDTEALAAVLRRVLTDRDLFNALASGAGRARQGLDDWPTCATRFDQALDHLSTSSG